MWLLMGFVCGWCLQGPTRSGLVGAPRAWPAARRARAHTFLVRYFHALLMRYLCVIMRDYALWPCCIKCIAAHGRRIHLRASAVAVARAMTVKGETLDPWLEGFLHPPEAPSAPELAPKRPRLQSAETAPPSPKPPPLPTKGPAFS